MVTVFILVCVAKGFGMSGGSALVNDFSMHVLRRKELINTIKQEYSNKKGVVVLFAGFEDDRHVFRQESSFYYLTGIKEASTVLVMDMDGETTLYLPNCGVSRSSWIYSPVELTQENAKIMGIDSVTTLGQPCRGYQLHPYFAQSEYQALLERLDNEIKNGGSIFTLVPDNAHEYQQQRLVLNRISQFILDFPQLLVDISGHVAAMRQRKDIKEIEKLYKAVEITVMAHEAAAGVIAPDVSECEVQASIEYMFIGSYARAAFPGIVAGGKNGTILHYTANKDTLKAGDLVVVDIGAEYDYYCADITRTYPVSGKFTEWQKKIYNFVLETQDYIASLARPGYWLSNKDYPEKSLNHLAKKYLQECGYGDYFIHGIGHYLGLDVHDVGDYKRPLQEGDVITIEPGIYIPEEKIGIRIEDDYWIVKDGAICLSEHLPKKPEEIEAMVQQNVEYTKPQLVHDFVTEARS